MPSIQDALSGSSVGLLEQVRHEQLGLAHGEPAASHDLTGDGLVAPWQRLQSQRRARRQQAEAHARLNFGLETFHEHEAATDPALVAPELGGDGCLRQPVVTMQRADEPALLELGQPLDVVQGDEPGLGIGFVQGVPQDAQLGPAELSGCGQALEAVEHLELFARPITISGLS